MSITLDGAAFYAKVDKIRQELSANVSITSLIREVIPDEFDLTKHICLFSRV